MLEHYLYSISRPLYNNVVFLNGNETIKLNPPSRRQSYPLCTLKTHRDSTASNRTCSVCKSLQLIASCCRPLIAIYSTWVYQNYSLVIPVAGSMAIRYGDWLVTTYELVLMEYSLQGAT